MTVKNVQAIIKEKAPIFALGTMAGALFVIAYVNRDKIANTVENALSRKPKVVN